MYLDTMNVAPPGHPCKQQIDKAQDECASSKKKGGKRVDCTKECQEAMNCIMVPKNQDKKLCCDPHNTGHHLVPAHCCKGVIPGYKESEAPTVCAGGWSWHRNDKSSIPNDEKTHPQLHEIQDPIERKIIRAIMSRGGNSAKPWKYSMVRNIGIVAHRKVLKPPCDKACMKSQLDAYHVKDEGDNPTLKAKEYGNKIPENDPVFENYPL
jgi:hypothetical protein